MNHSTPNKHKKRCENAAWRLPWWLSGKKSTCPWRRHRLDPWSGKIPHVAKQRIPPATTIEPALQSLGAATTELVKPTNYWKPTRPRAPTPRPAKPPPREACAAQLGEEALLFTTREKPCSHGDPAEPISKHPTSMWLAVQVAAACAAA